MPPAYRLDAPAARIARELDANPGDDVWTGGTVVPGGYAPVVIGDRAQGRHLVPRQWGAPPPPRGEHPVPFVRNLDSPFWVGVLRHTGFRCLVPMTAFRARDGWFTAPPGTVFACAGIWRDSEIPSFAVLTRGTGRALPVILDPGDCAIWLEADIRLARRLVEAAGPAAPEAAGARD